MRTGDCAQGAVSTTGGCRLTECNGTFRRQEGSRHRMPISSGDRNDQPALSIQIRCWLRGGAGPPVLRIDRGETQSARRGSGRGCRPRRSVRERTGGKLPGLGQRLGKGVRKRGMLGTATPQLPLQHANAHLPQTEFATAGGLQMLFGCDYYLLDRVFTAADLNRGFIAFINNLAVVITITEACLSPLLKFVPRDRIAHPQRLREMTEAGCDLAGLSRIAAGRHAVLQRHHAPRCPPGRRNDPSG